MKRNPTMELYVLRGTNLNTDVYRGFARLADLAFISNPDTYNENTNPWGTQRGLDQNHATWGYLYAETGRGASGNRRMWPEIFLNVRDTSIVDVEDIQRCNGETLAKLTIHLDKIDKNRTEPQISRVDGNHRLWFCENGTRQHPEPAESISPFSLTIGLSREEELAVFKDENTNQKGMNTSHLDHIMYRLRQDSQLADQDPALWIAEKLVEDPDSPFHGLVYRGGERVREASRFINLRTLKNCVSATLQSSNELAALPGSPQARAEAQYSLIKQFWKAVKYEFRDDWHKNSLLLKSVGTTALSITGGYILDKSISGGERIEDNIRDEVRALRKTKIDDQFLTWERNGPIAAFGGMKGARQLAEHMKRAIARVPESFVNRMAERS